MAKFQVNDIAGIFGNVKILKVEEIESRIYYEVLINNDPRIVKLPEEVLFKLPEPKDFERKEDGKE